MPNRFASFGGALRIHPRPAHVQVEGRNRTGRKIPGVLDDPAFDRAIVRLLGRDERDERVAIDIERVTQILVEAAFTVAVALG